MVNPSCTASDAGTKARGIINDVRFGIVEITSSAVFIAIVETTDVSIIDVETLFGAGSTSPDLVVLWGTRAAILGLLELL